MRHQWTDEDRCYAAAQWGGGETQKAIGRQFGYANGATICVEIERFLNAYTLSPLRPERGDYAPGILVVQGEDRRRLVPFAIKAFLWVRRRRLRVEGEHDQRAHEEHGGEG